MELKYLGVQSGMIGSQAVSACFPSGCARKMLRPRKLLMGFVCFFFFVSLGLVFILFYFFFQSCQEQSMGLYKTFGK